MADPDPLRQSLGLFKGQQFWQTTPFNIKAGRKFWTVCTDGGYFMAIHGKQAKLTTLEREGVSTLLVAAVIKPAHGVETERLKSWAGPVPESRVFPWDNVDEEHWGTLFGLCVDRRRLACILENIPEGMISVWAATKTLGVAGIGLEGKVWRAFLAGLKDGPDSDTPKFEFRKPPATGADLIDELPQE